VEQTIIGRVGLIGDPVEHSLSPAFQQAAFDALGIKVRYELWRTPPEAIPERLAALRAGEIQCANVTVPHKEAFFRLVDERSQLAERVGAVNTLLVRDGLIFGDNTDVYGFLHPLREHGFPFEQGDAIVLGAGGAARGVVVALLDAGMHRVIVANRTLQRANALRDALADERITACELASASDFAANASLLVNSTALGWQAEQLPIDRALFAQLPRGAVAYDLTYRETPFLATAADAGLDILDGLPMLVHQGARSFEIWTGRSAPLDVMWTAARAAARQQPNVGSLATDSSRHEPHLASIVKNTLAG
jgi:shikimate dehydrogenase